MKHDSKLAWFDFFRGVAAFIVTTGHLRALILDDFTKTSNPFIKLFYFVTGFAHDAVMVFFVLSGFFIISSIHQAVISNRWSAKDYMINRLTRLWVVLLPALILTFLLDKVGLMQFKNAYTYTGTITTMTAINPYDSLSFGDFIGNLFFLQYIKVPTFGSNGALWSLANEFWYYTLFPLLYFSVRKHYSWLTRVFLLILALACFYFIGINKSEYFIIWLMGGAAFIIIKKDLFLKKYIALKLWLILLAFCTVLLYARVNTSHPGITDFSVGLVTCFLLCVFSKTPMKNSYLRKASVFFSNISYTVYATHLSFSVLLVTIFYTHRVPFTFLSFVSYTLIFIANMVYCYALYYLFERNTPLVKQYVKKILAIKSSSELAKE
ncbi:MAG TPA: acyltransferase [Puia sp.]|nr:acyltransferase [Puia sp.]